jgi:hypothetical protein
VDTQPYRKSGSSSGLAVLNQNEVGRRFPRPRLSRGLVRDVRSSAERGFIHRNHRSLHRLDALHPGVIAER